MREFEKINPLFRAGLELQDALSERQWAFCYIGGLAVIRWGELRMTQDIDLCLLCGFGNEEQYIKTLLSMYTSRISDAHQFALQNRVLLLSASNGVSVDVSLSGLPYEEKMINRATPYTFEENCSLITCSAEDLIILKAFADRAKDWMDVESIIDRQGEKLDTTYVIDHLAPLCELKESPEILKRVKQLLQENTIKSQ